MTFSQRSWSHMTLQCQLSTFWWMVQLSLNLLITLFLARKKKKDMLRSFDLDLQLKVTETFKGQKITFLSPSLLKIALTVKLTDNSICVDFNYFKSCVLILKQKCKQSLLQKTSETSTCHLLWICPLVLVVKVGGMIS